MATLCKKMKNKFTYTINNFNHFRDIVKSEYNNKIKVVDITRLSLKSNKNL